MGCFRCNFRLGFAEGWYSVRNLGLYFVGWVGVGWVFIALRFACVCCLAGVGFCLCFGVVVYFVISLLEFVNVCFELIGFY